MFTKINEYELRTLAQFTKGYNKEYYIREIARLLKISSRTAFLTLASLEKKGILESRLRGKIRNYSIRLSAVSREYFLMAEVYKKILFIHANPFIGEVLEKSAPYMKGIAAIFGSYAKGTQKTGSDLDIFVQGRYDSKKLAEISRKYRIEINVKCYPLKKNDFLTREVQENHVIVKNAEQYVRGMLQWTDWNGAHGRGEA